MTHTYSRSVLMVYSTVVSRYVRPARFRSVATPHPMEDITELSELMLKFGRVDSSGQTCMETQRNLCGVAQDVKSMGTSIPETQCHSRAIFKWTSLTFGELTSWVHSQCQSNANTSWWLWTTCPNGSKHFLVLRPTQGAPGKCFRKLYFLVLEFQES